MTRIRTSLCLFCLGKASEARRKAEVAATYRDYEHWSAMKAKWNDLANFYCGGKPIATSEVPAAEPRWLNP
jgi:hypothetical protein